MKFVWLITAVVMLGSSVRADESIDYAKQIKPVLQARCFACHGVLKQQAKLRLDTAAFAISGGESGAAIKPGDVSASLLLKRISAVEESERMPPEGEPLKPAEITAIKAWIEQGAKAPSDEQPERDPRDHWAFKTPVRPGIPDHDSQIVDRKSKNKNPIDAFIAAEHHKRGLTSQPPADKRVWLRRVSLDLTGLPPTREELEAFDKDGSEEAYDKVVNRLLDSPQYGERWGRHWMDIWRYSDWWGLGAEVRNSQKHIWHWRDWIIESLNADKGYDQMLREMLAADELYPNDLDRLRASGFLARQYFKFNRTSWLDETVEHTAKAMLGLTFNCAKCHDHKYDPFAQLDYYRIRAIFEPYQVRTDLVPGETDFEKDGIPRAFDCNLDAQTFLHIRGDDRNPDKARVIEPTFPAFLSWNETKIEPLSLPAEAVQPGLRPFVIETYLKQAEQHIADAHAALASAKKQLSEAAKKADENKPGNAKDDRDQKDAKRSDVMETAESKPVVEENFATAKPGLWEMRDGMWTYSDGKLIQSQAGAVRAALRLKQLPPVDFEAKLRYVPTGGDMWKSVGLTFDVTEAGNETLAYLSSNAPGPKSQVSYKVGGNHVYPAEGAQARQIELNKPHELTLRVRGTLVNVIVDGQHSIAYRLPIARQRGMMELITYDAKVELLSFELRELPTDVKLAQAESVKGKPFDGPQPVDQAKLAVVIAEKALAAAEAQPTSIKARAAADWARAQQPPADNVAVLIADAVRAERIAAAAKADEEVSRTELDVLRATPEKRAEAEKKLVAAKAAFDAAHKSIDMPGESYTSLIGASKMLESNLETEASRSKPFPQTSTGRRSAFAKWLTDPKHPLPARVAVNHIWSRHFGRPLVPTVFDFGRKGTPPTHPELLDWLAVELIDHNWSMKHIHRLIVTSQTYRRTSSSKDDGGMGREGDGEKNNAGQDSSSRNGDSVSANLSLDPENRFYWRMNPIRMEAQTVRDTLLSLAGELDLTLGGPSIPVNNEASRRRSLYFVHSHNEHQKFLSMFDDASVLECYRRAESIVPQQALALENSPLATTMAEKIAQRLAASNPTASEQDFIRAAFLTVLSVEPTESEQATVAEALARLIEAGKFKNRTNPEAQARANLIHALLNHNDFVTVR